MLASLQRAALQALSDLGTTQAETARFKALMERSSDCGRAFVPCPGCFVQGVHRALLPQAAPVGGMALAVCEGCRQSISFRSV